MFNTNILKEGSRIIKQETPKLLVRTVDVYPDLTPIERETLYLAERKNIKLLTLTTKRHA
jgi:hypothetical protein